MARLAWVRSVTEFCSTAKFTATIEGMGGLVFGTVLQHCFITPFAPNEVQGLLLRELSLAAIA